MKSMVVEEIQGGKSIEQLLLKDVKTGEVHSESMDGVFIYVGYTPNTRWLEEIKLDDHGYILADEQLKTNIPGVFAAGDIREKLLRQVSTAVGDGATAAMAAEKYLGDLEG